MEIGKRMSFTLFTRNKMEILEIIKDEVENQLAKKDLGYSQADVKREAEKVIRTMVKICMAVN